MVLYSQECGKMFASASVCNQTTKDMTVTTQHRPEQPRVLQSAKHSNQIEKSIVTANPVSRNVLGPKASDKTPILCQIWCCNSTHRWGGNFWVIPCCPLWHHQVNVWATRETVHGASAGPVQLFAIDVRSAFCITWSLQTRFLLFFCIQMQWHPDLNEKDSMKN